MTSQQAFAISYNLIAPYVLAILIGIGLPLFAMALAKAGKLWSDDAKLSVVLLAMILSTVIGVAVSGRVLHTTAELLANPMLRYTQPESAHGFWVSRIATGVLLAVTVPEIIRWVLGERSMEPGARKLLVAALLYWFVSVVIAGLGGTARNLQLSMIYMPIFFTGVALLASADLSRPLLALRLGMFAMMAGSLLIAIFVPNMARDRDYISVIPGLSWRLVGLADHANYLGALAVVALLLELSPRASNKPRLLFLVPCLLVLLLAQSKTSWIEALVGVGLVRYYDLKVRVFGSDKVRGTIGLFAVLAAIAAVLVVLAGVALSSDRLADYFGKFNFETLTGRTDIWAVTLSEFFNSPVLGYGPSLWDTQFRREHGMLHVGQAHNQLVHTLGQAGALGAFALLYYVWRMMRGSLWAWAPTGGLSVAFVSIALIAGITESPLRMEGILGFDAVVHSLAFLLAATGRPRVNATTGWLAGPSRLAPKASRS